MSENAYFSFWQRSPNGTINTFFFKLSDPIRIAQARQILADPTRIDRHVQGTVLQYKAAYNPDWSFHLDPKTIGFFEQQIEVCDANMTYIEEHLDEIGGSTLPKSFWCPWHSTLAAEVTHLVDSQTEKLMI
ncbi:hypothetical protein ABID16_004495 [Rhizobium aquaticum]|uniref:BP74 N-terminal domain-containing protein n=1 Tax=Rhizobium aquaticum TaxID=1549636 RepID=A0ABV2J5W8_9HYPH